MYIKSPLNYIGGKTKILSQILPLFPEKINRFVDLFSGGCNVGVNVSAKEVYFNDNLSYLVEMFRFFQENDFQDTIFSIEARIREFELSLTNAEGYLKLREAYNLYKNPLDLFVLVAFSFNHQIRFNNKHQFNNPFGRERSSFNPSMRQNLERFILKIKKMSAIFSDKCFSEFDFSMLDEADFVYCDPPYLITLGTYNDGKRGFKGWSPREELQLLKILDDLHQRNIKFALSNVLEHKGKSNDILKEWLENQSDYQVNYINHHYSNSNYQTLVKDKNASTEVLITNYNPVSKKEEFNLFSINEMSF